MDNNILTTQLVLTDEDLLRFPPDQLNKFVYDTLGRQMINEIKRKDLIEYTEEYDYDYFPKKICKAQAAILQVQDYLDLTKKAAAYDELTNMLSKHIK